MSRTILLAGGTGLVGTRLSVLLRERGYTVRLLSRQPRGPEQYRWDPAAGDIDLAAFDGGLAACINLAGENIAGGRWTAERRRRIIDSRVQSNELLAAAFEETGQRPGVYISASAIGFYGDSGEQLMTEVDAPTEGGFMVHTCQLWEDAARAVATAGIRTVIFRIGIVLSRDGGALPPVAGPLRFGIGSYFSDGKAWWSWIHIDDLCRAFLWAVEQPAAEGTYNLVAPHPVRNKPFVAAVARAMHRPEILVPVPAVALKLALGDMSKVVLNSNRVSAEKLERAGFQFEFPQVEAALAALFR